MPNSVLLLAFKQGRKLPAAGDLHPLGLRVGMSDFLSKSIDSALLYRTLEPHLHKPG